MQGLDPSQTQLATFLATLQIKAEHEARLARHLLEKSLMTTIDTVNTHTQDIANVKQCVDTLQSGQSDLQRNQQDIYTQLHHIHSLAWKSYQTAEETKQRSSKGNFIVQGDHIPYYSPTEDLYAMIFPMIYEKYGVHCHAEQMKHSRELSSVLSRTILGSTLVSVSLSALGVLTFSVFFTIFVSSIKV